MKLNGSDIIAEVPIEHGVDTVFGYPGGAVLNIYDALYKYRDKIHHILTAHEQGASHGGRLRARNGQNRRGHCNKRPRRNQFGHRYRHGVYGFRPDGRDYRQRRHVADWS